MSSGLVEGLGSSAAQAADAAELRLTLSRSGKILSSGGAQLPELAAGLKAGTVLAAVWPEPLVARIAQLTSKAIALRGSSAAELAVGNDRYAVRVTALGPERVDCVIRALPSLKADPSTLTLHSLQRRLFQRQLKESIALAALRERPLALAVIQVEGLADIAQLLEPAVTGQLVAALLERITAAAATVDDLCLGSSGEIAQGVLAQLLDSSDRSAIRRYLSRLCAALGEPVSIGESSFHLSAYVGVALLGQDATAPRTLLEYARRAAVEARARGTEPIHFCTDTLKLRSLARLDIARELRQAITEEQIRLHYIGRHELVNGNRLTEVAYVRWEHPLRGQIRPAEFLRIAETTGLALVLSRAALHRLEQDYQTASRSAQQPPHLSFGPLRHHVLHRDFLADIEAVLARGLPARRLELRIAEKTFLACKPALLDALNHLGVQLVVDEVARGLGSLDGLARAPLWGLQLDRAWVTALQSAGPSSNEVALKVCRAAMQVAGALGLEPIATGIDSAEQRDALLDMGCRLGCGDLYLPTPAT
jgi:predicted signal transduction protein with EAL and GGDEF domain